MKDSSRLVSGFMVAFVWWIICAFLVTTVTLAASLPTSRRIGRIVDASLERVGDTRRISDVLPSWGLDGTAGLAGVRFSLKNNAGTAVVFSVSSSGVSGSFVALFHPQRGIDKVFALDPDSGDLASRLPAGLVELYLTRIETAEGNASGARRLN